jgi:predicted transcriptional regulator
MPQKPPKSIRFPDDVKEAIEKKAKQRQRSFQWIVIDVMRKQLIDKKNKKV